MRCACDMIHPARSPLGDLRAQTRPPVCPYPNTRHQPSADARCVRSRRFRGVGDQTGNPFKSVQRPPRAAWRCRRGIGRAGRSRLTDCSRHLGSADCNPSRHRLPKRGVQVAPLSVHAHALDTLFHTSHTVQHFALRPSTFQTEGSLLTTTVATYISTYTHT